MTAVAFRWDYDCIIWCFSVSALKVINSIYLHGSKSFEFGGVSSVFLDVVCVVGSLT